MLDWGAARLWGRIETMQDYLLWFVAGGMLLLAMVAGLGEWRRQRRKDFDDVGFMPWQLVQVLALCAAVAFAYAALLI